MLFKDRLEQAMPTCFEIGNAFAPHILGEDFLKKIGFSDGVRALWCILKYNLRRSV